MQNTETYNTLQKPEILFPTMKPTDVPAKAKASAAQEEKKEAAIDFSKVKIEPLFEEEVDFETFSKSDFRAVKIKECSAVPKSKKLLKFVLDDGSEKDRVILSGIHEYYEPEELVGKTAIAIVNLPPRKMIGIIGGLPRLSSTQERISAYRQAVADCGLPEDEHLIQYGDSLENSACACLDQLLERKCDAIIVCQGLMASETIIYLHQKGIQLAQDIDLVSFVDYDSDVYALYANQMDSIIQPVEDLGQAAGEQILRRVEVPDAPIFENVLTSTYRPYNQPRAWSHSDR